jgi:hypothetical protein
MTARIIDCTTEEYNQDPCATVSLSRSVAHTLVSRSPIHAYMQHPKFGGAREALEDDEVDEKEKAALTRGTLIHKLLLGKGADVAVIHHDTYNTKAARLDRDEAKAAGKTPIKAKDYETVAVAAARLLDNCRALGYDFTGQSEVCVEFEEQGLNGPILCRTMFDHVFLSEGVIYELKSIRNAHPEKMRRSFFDYGYDMQHAVQKRALSYLLPELQGRIEHHFLFIELSPPYVVTPVEPSGAYQEIGESRWRRALDAWEKCLATKHWPPYNDGVPVVLDPPEYLIVQELGNEWR